MRIAFVFLILFLSGCASEEPLAEAPSDPVVDEAVEAPIVEQVAEGPIDGDSLVCHGAPDTGTGSVSLDIDPATWGLSYALEFRSGAAHVHYKFLDGAGTTLAEDGGGVSGGGWSFQGTVPEDAAQLTMYACENTFGEDYTYRAA